MLERRLASVVSTCVCARNMTTTVASAAHERPKSFQDIPGPSGIYQWPFIGLKLQLKPFSKIKVNRLDELMLHYKQLYGDICKVRMGNKWMVFLFDPNAIELALRNEGKYPKRSAIMILERFYADKPCPSMSVLQGKEWHDMRRPAQLAMKNPRRVSKFVPQLSEVADDFVKKYRSKEVMEKLPQPCLEYSTESAGTLCFGLRLGCIHEENTGTEPEIMPHIKGFFSTLGESIYSIPWYMKFDTSMYKRFVKHIAFLRSFADTHLQNAYLELEKNTIGEEGANLMLDMIHTPGMTSEMVSNNLIDLFIAAVDSTAQALSFLLYQLAKHPEKQETLFKEICDHVPPVGHIKEDAFGNLPYIKACLKESFRLVFPVAIGSTRILDDDIQLLGYNVPKGCVIAGGNSVIGKDERFFPQPDKFLPERWLRNEQKNIHAFAQLPFGFGRRDCIGRRFAEQEVYTCIAKIVRNYKLSLPEGTKDIPYVYQTFATPKQPFSLKLQQR